MSRGGTTLYVTGFSHGTRARDLAYEFERFAFVEYEDRRDADDAYHEMHNKRIGRDDLLKIEWARTPPSASWRFESGRDRDRRGPRSPRRGRSPSPRRSTRDYSPRKEERRDRDRDYDRDSRRDRDRSRSPEHRDRDRDAKDERDDRDRKENGTNGDERKAIASQRRAVPSIPNIKRSILQSGISPASSIMNVLKLQRKFPQFPQNEIFQLSDAFQRLDVEDRGYLDEATAIKATQQSENQPYDVVRQALKEVDLDSSRRVELEDYVGLIAKLRAGSVAQKRMSTGPTPAQPGPGPAHGHASKGSVSGKIQVQGSNANTTHTINEDERTEFTRHINAVLAGDPDIGSRLPFPTDTFEMFDECKDGLVLAKLINDSVPDTIDERVMNIPGRKTKTLNAFQMSENNNIVIESCKGIGCSVVNIGAGDIIEVREHLILGLIWQIIRRGLLGKIDIKLHPELYRLLEEDETLEQFLRLPPEQILLRWFNYHLKAANWPRRVTNFSSDVKDSENYTVLLAQIGSEYGCTRAALQTRDLAQRAEETLQEADKLGCRKFLTPSSLVAGNPKLNLAFVANLFNTHPALDPITEEEKLEVEDFDAEGEREARVFTLWLNSLDVQPAVVSFFDDLRDGSVLMQAYDKVIPGSVNWRHVNKAPAHGGEMLRFKAVENTNYAIELGKQNGFSLVGIQGADITDGQRTLTLGLVWQLMRKNITVTLSSLAQKLGKREITDSEMVRWANDMSKKGGRNSSIRSFKDPAIGSGIFLLDVLNGMKSSYVDYDLVTPGQTEEDAYMNAKLSISIARKLGATIWLVPEDICQVRSRLVTTFIGSLMATHDKM
ncbi:hypothetical protein Trihar35433_10995 [Trichoderma harzianum]|nr:hypothetical protein Trihar35433_10995 [Trichoderma harzianum]